MFSLDHGTMIIAAIILGVISRYLGMFSLDLDAWVVISMILSYFPLSWDVLIRWKILVVIVSSSYTVISRYLGMFSLDIL